MQVITTNDRNEPLQSYDLDYTSEKPVKPKPVESENKQPMADSFDVYDMVSSVHMKKSDMTRDFVLANYSADVVSMKLPRFIREQIKTLKIIDLFLNVPEDRLRDRYNNTKTRKKVRKALKCSTKDIRKIIMSEINSMVIMSRALKGEVARAMLKHGMTPESKEEYDLETGKENQTLKERMLEQTK